MQGCRSAARGGFAGWLALVAALALGPATAVAQTTYTVTSPNDDGACEGTSCSSLRAALRAAGDGDTIRLRDHGRPYEQAGQQGAFVITSDVTLVGDGADATVIEGDGDRVFEVTAPEGGEPPTVVMAHLQVADGFLSFGAGGNILNYGNLALDHVRVTGGRAYQGGGVANIGGALVIQHSLIDGNSARYSESGAEGGGVYSVTYDDGGGLAVYDSTIAFNTAQRGAGVAIRYSGQSEAFGVGALQRVTVARNVADESAPAGLLIGGDARVIVSGSLIADNVVNAPDERRRAPNPSNCDPLARPIDGDGNLSNTGDCGFKTPPADPQLSEELVGGLGETPLLTIPAGSPAVDLAGGCDGTDQRDLARPQGAACDAGAYEVPAAPPAVIVSGPAGATSDPSPSFAFSAGEGQAVFECRIDGPGGAGPWEACVSPKRYAALAPGAYTFLVRADGGEPATRSFTVAAPPAPVALPVPAVPAQTPAPTPTATPQPVFRRSVSVKPTRGTVKVKLPGTGAYVDLERLDTIPLGASIDVRKGRVRLYAARDRRGGVQAASFSGGVFRVVQRGSVIELQLRGPKPVCGSGARMSQAKKSRKRRLWGSGRGRFRTRGRFSAATVRGTKWLVEDSCRSTTTRVVRGAVTVRDFDRRRTLTLRAGDRYVARRR